MRLKDIDNMQREAMVIIESELERMINSFSSQLNFVRPQQVALVQDRIKDTANKSKAKSSKEIYDDLNEILETEIEKILVKWNQEQEIKIKESYKIIIERFTSKLNEAIQQINDLTYSFFKVKVAQEAKEIELIDRDTFFFKFNKSNTSVLAPKMRDFRFLLPKKIRDTKILDDTLKRVEAELERNGNNLKWDYVQKIRDSKYTFERFFSDYIQEVVDVYDSTISKILKLKSENSNIIQEKELYLKKKDRIHSLKERLHKIN